MTCEKKNITTNERKNGDHKNQPQEYAIVAQINTIFTLSQFPIECILNNI